LDTPHFHTPEKKKVPNRSRKKGKKKKRKISGGGEGERSTTIIESENKKKVKVLLGRNVRFRFSAGKKKGRKFWGRDRTSNLRKRGTRNNTR